MSKDQINPANAKLAELLGKQRQQFGESMAKFAARFSQNSQEPERTYIAWEQGKRAPQANVRGNVEKALGWKDGSIGLLLTGEGVSMSLEDVRDIPLAERPVKRASELSDDELLTEVTRRFKNYAHSTNGKPPMPPAQTTEALDLNSLGKRWVEPF